MSRIRSTLITFHPAIAFSLCRAANHTFRPQQWQSLYRSLRRTNMVAAAPRVPRSLVPPPRPGGAPIMERREDRELPDIRPKRTYLIGVPAFIITMVISAGAIFNYQRASSSVVSSTLYAVRVNTEARELLGDEIQFKSKLPWISGTMDQLHGLIDIEYSVKGTKSDGVVHFKSIRQGGKAGYFRTAQWELILPNGKRVELLVDEDKLAIS